MKPPPLSRPPWSPELARRIDAACDAFESACRGGSIPRAEDHLGDLVGSDRTAALGELLALELDYAQRSGAVPTRAALISRLPDHADLVAGLLGPAAQTTPAFGTPNPMSPTIPGFDILGELGRGGSGVVYLARQRTLDRVVALKMLHGAAATESASLVRLLAEATVIAQLQHPNIVRLYEVLQIAGVPVLCLEYVNGGTLTARLATGPMAIAESTALIETLARAIDHAHQAGIVHRDLKPSNVLLGNASDGSQPKITDFGLARRMLLGSGLTESGTVAGTPAYMSPEQASGQTHKAGPPADVWSLGAILYECLTGRPPFVGETHAEILPAVINDDPLPPRQLRPSIPRDIETICLKCLHKDPERRYASASALAEDLRRQQNGETILARPASLIERAWKWTRRRPTLAALLTVLLLVGLVGFPIVTVLWYAAEEARENEKNQRLRVGRLLHESEKQELRLGIDRGLSLCNQGEILEGLAELNRALPLAEHLGDEARTRAIRINLTDWAGCLHRRADTIPKNLKGIASLNFTADGRTVFVTSGSTVRPHDVLAGTRGSLTLEPWAHNWSLRNVWTTALSPDGKLALTGRSDGMARLWDLESGQPRPPDFRHGNANVWAVAFSPDGQRCATGAGDGVTRVYDPATGKTLGELPFTSAVLCLAFAPDSRSLLIGYLDSTARIWHVDQDRLRDVTYRLPDRVVRAAFLPDGESALLASRDGRVSIWKMETDRPDDDPLRHRDEVLDLSLDRAGRMVLVGCKDGSARLWSLGNRQPIGPALWVDSPATAVALSPDGSTALVGTQDGEIARWILGSDRSLSAPIHEKSPIRQIAWSVDGQRVLIRDEKQTAIHDLIGGQLRLRGHFRSGTRQRSAQLNWTGDGVLVGSWHRGLESWSIGKAIGREPDPMTFGKEVGIKNILATPDGTLLLVTTDEPNHIQSWNPGPPAERGHIRSMSASVEEIVLSADGSTLAARASDRSICVWDIASVEPRFQLAGTAPATLALNADGSRLALGGLDGTVRVHDLKHGTHTVEIRHVESVLALAFFPDGQRLVTGGGDRAARVIDLASGIVLGPPLRHTDAVVAVAVSPDGSSLLTGGRDGKVQRWRVPTELK